MGVTGLWQILDPAGRPVTLESLDGQVLAVDISIWLNQALSAMRDSSGNVISNAHLINLYQRLCKLLFYHIRPVFVFDGVPPALKQATLRARRQRKELAREEKQDIDKKLLQNYLKQHALNHVAQERSKKTGAPVAAPPKLPPRGFRSGNAQALKDSHLFILPEVDESKLAPDGYQTAVERHWQERKEIVNSVLESDLIKRNILSKESVDFESDEFKSLPLDVQHEILTEIKLRRKDKHSWHKIKQMPKNPSEFMDFQLKTVLFRGRVTHRLDKLQTDMKRESAGDVVTTLTRRYHDGEEGKNALIDSSRVASREGAHYVLIKNNERKSFMSRVAEENRKQEEEDLKIKIEKAETKQEENFENSVSDYCESEEDEDETALQRALALSLQNHPSEIGKVSKSKLSDGTGTRFRISQIFEKMQSEDKESVWKVSKDTVEEYVDVGTVDGETASNEDDLDLQKTTTQGRRQAESSKTVGSALNDNNSSEFEKSLDFSHEFVVTDEDTSKLLREGSEVSANTDLQQSNEKNDVYITRDDHNEEKRSVSEKSDILLVKEKFTEQNSEHVNQQRTAILKMLDDQKRQMECQNIDPDVVEEVEGKDNNVERKECDMLATKTVFEKLQQKTLKTVNHHNVGEPDVTFRRKNPVSTSKGGSSNDDDVDCAEVEDPTISEPNAACPNIHISNNDEDKNAYAAEGENPVSTSEDGSSDEDFEEVEDVSTPNAICPNIQNSDINDEDKNSGGEKHILPSGGGNETEIKSNNKPDLAEEYLAQQTAEKGLRDLGSKLDEERMLLEETRMKHDRMDVSMSDQMTSDCQELLRLFGIPFVVATSEAEAQCAFLETVGLTQGTITDDSDIWLFGGQVVYRNLFKKEKDVERFKIGDIVSHLCLDQHKMICFGMMTGSDYTDGVEGVGGVSAFELVHEFKVEDFEGLNRMKRWWTSASIMPFDESFGNKVKNRFRKLKLSEGFPSEAVYRAYLDPSVDDSLEEFSWAAPDVTGVREFARRRLGWDREKTDETLMPVLEKMKERRPGTLDKWVRKWSNTAVAAKKAQGIPSQRIKQVLTKLKVLDEEEVQVVRTKNKGKGKKNKTKNDEQKKTTKTIGPRDPTKPKPRKTTARFDVEFRDPDSAMPPENEPSKVRKSIPNPQATSNSKTDDKFVVQSRSIHSRKNETTVHDGHSMAVPPSRPSAGGGRGKKRRGTKLTDVERVLQAAASAPKMLRPEVDTMDFSDDDDDFMKAALVVEASQTDQQPKWEKSKTNVNRSYKTLANLSESESSSDSN